MLRRCWLPSKKVVKEPHHRFLHHLCKMFGKLPSDSFFEEMDPVEKAWLYESWINELELDLEREKAIAILIGSFSNYEMAKKMQETPTVSVSDEEFEAQLKAQEARFKAEENPRAQRKKKRKEKRMVVK